MSRPVRLCRYAYDPLDRLASRSRLAGEPVLNFYQVDRLATQIQGTRQRSFMYHDSQLLAHYTLVGKLAATALIATDSQHSVLHADEAAIAYAPYGHRNEVMALPGLSGFNGQQPDPVTGHYLLGNGYRAYNPALMRFNSPDSLSPFGKGGLNAYAYCGGDPVNRSDPSGHEVDTRQLLSYVWVGLGLFGAVWGVKAALPALKAINKGAATQVQQLAARSAVSQVTASALFTASGMVNAVEPGAPESTFLLAFAIGIAVPTVPARIRASSLTSSAAKKAAQVANAANTSITARPVQSTSGSRASSIRSGIEETRL
jgi:RHS repeat-associated protein